MNSDQAVAAMKRLVSERNSGKLTTADYRHLRACLLDALVGMSPSAADRDPTRPRVSAAPSVDAGGGLRMRFVAWRFALGAAILAGLVGLVCWRVF